MNKYQIGDKLIPGMKIVKAIVRECPEVYARLRGRARWMAADAQPYKTQDFYLNALERLVRSLYNNDIGGEFVDVMASLIQGQLTDAYEQAWKDDGDDGPLPEYLSQAAEEAILSEFDYVDQLFRDIIDARLDETPIEPLLTRCELWANKWTGAYNDGVRLIALENGERLVWRVGDTEHCETCHQLDGIVAYASTWEELNVQPQNAPNDLLICGGYRCQCALEPTEQRQSPNAYDLILNAVTK